jgi:hypothetical protein
MVAWRAVRPVFVVAAATAAVLLVVVTWAAAGARPAVGGPSYNYDAPGDGTTTWTGAHNGAFVAYDDPAERSRVALTFSGPRLAAEGVGAALTAPTRITGYAVGRDGVRHGIHQAISRDGGRGVSPQAILNAVRGAKPEYQASRGTWKYSGDDAVVILNSRGQVVTTWARGSRGWRNQP